MSHSRLQVLDAPVPPGIRLLADVETERHCRLFYSLITEDRADMDCVLQIALQQKMFAEARAYAAGQNS